MVRPIIANFSSGEIDPKLEGRIDLPLYAGGARELTNFSPARLGGAFKRGGLHYKLNCPTHTGPTRLIPWSISDDVDILIALYDNAIKIIDVSAGIDPVYMTDPEGNALTITTLDGPGGAVSAYDESDIFEVNYAQNGSEITMVHKDYPAFFISVIDADATTHRIFLRYGLYQFFGNIAYNSPASASDEEEEISSADLADALRDAVSGTTYACTDSYVYIGDVKHTVSSISATITPASTNFKIYGRDMTTVIYDMGYVSSIFPHGIGYPVHYQPAEYFLWVILMNPARWYLDKNHKYISPGATYREIIDRLMEDGYNKKWFELFVDHGGEVGWNYFTEDSSEVRYAYLDWAPYSYSIVITYDTGTLTITSASATTLKCSITVDILGVKINGTRTSGSVVFDSVAPWMKRDKVYQCDQFMLLNGVAPMTAVKRLVSGKESIVLTYPSEGGVLEINRDTTGITGQLGVITTPFYDFDDKPRAVCYHQGRLCLAGDGNTVYLSKTNDHSNFCYFEDIEFDATSLKPASTWADPLVPETRYDTDKTQQVGASSAMMLEIATDENEDIQWMVSVSDLVIGTRTTEWVMPAECTAINPRMIQYSRGGSCAIQARFAGNSIVFVSSSGKNVRVYSSNQNSSPPSISEHASHLLLPGVIGFDFRQDPVQELLFWMGDGTMLRLVSDSEIPQWSRIKTREGDEIESVASVNAADEDAVYCIVKRTINGSVYRFIERFDSPSPSTFAGRGHLDSAVYIASTSAGSITGLSRFGTESISVVFRPSSGIEVRGTTVLSGGTATTYIDSITGLSTAIPANAEAWVGFAFTSRLETFRIDDVETEGLLKGGGSMHLRVYSSGSFNIKRGYEESETGYTIQWPVTSLNAMIYPYSGSLRVEHDAPWNIDQSVVIESTDDQPVNILVIAPSYEVGASS